MSPRLLRVFVLYGALFLMLGVSLGIQAARAQTISCPSGGPGGAGGLGGITTGGTGGSARTDGFASATAPGGDSGDASGGRGGSGGDAGLVVCNQNTNTVTEDAGVGAGLAPSPPAPAPVIAAAAAGSPFAPSSEAPLGTTGARTDVELGLAGVLLIVGGVLVAATIDRRRRGGETLVDELVTHDALPDPDELWLRHAMTRTAYDPAETHARRVARAQRRQSIIRRPAPAVVDEYPYLRPVVDKWADVG